MLIYNKNICRASRKEYLLLCKEVEIKLLHVCLYVRVSAPAYMYMCEEKETKENVCGMIGHLIENKTVLYLRSIL